jgi:hypothetical protein
MIGMNFTEIQARTYSFGQYPLGFVIIVVAFVVGGVSLIVRRLEEAIRAITILTHLHLLTFHPRRTVGGDKIAERHRRTQ